MRSAFLLLLFSSAVTQAQNQYFANDPVWNQTSVCNSFGGSNGNCIGTDVFSYRVTGDSLLAGQTYVKLMRVGTVTNMWMGPPPAIPGCTGSDTYAPYLMGLLRQDGLRIWQWEGDAEQLLYDFDLEVGGVLPQTLNNWNPDISVIAIDSFLVGNEWRKRFELANSWAPYLLEGIGSSHGLFEPISNFFDCGYELTCYGLGNESFYPTGDPVCDLATGRPQTSLDYSTFALFPNPAKDRLVITVPGSTSSQNVRLVDLQGRELLRFPMVSRRMETDVSGLPAGVYILTVGDHRQRVVIAR